MNKDFFAPAKYKMALPGTPPDVSGGLIFPSGIMAGALKRRDLSKKYPHLQRRLLDPQLYLAELPASSCRTACSNLVSYPWFGAKEFAEYESGSQTQAEWRNELKAEIMNIWPGTVPANPRSIEVAVSSCVVFQRDLGCEAVVLPSPLTVDPSTSYSRELEWMDAGLKLSANLAPNLTACVTIALSDSALRGTDPYQNDLLTLIVDQVTARSAKGAYLVIEQATEQGYYCGHPNTVGSLLRLVSELRRGGLERIVMAPVGLAGILGLAAGADTWSVGWYRGERRIKLSDFTDQVGMAVPTYYSHPAATEIHLDSDLDKIVQNGLFKLVADETEASKDLVRALRAGRKVASVPEWQYRKSNVSAACEHLLRVAVRETEVFTGRSEKSDIDGCLAWINQAEKTASQLYRLGGLNPRTELAHQSSWRRAFSAFSKTI